MTQWWKTESKKKKGKIGNRNGKKERMSWEYYHKETMYPVTSVMSVTSITPVTSHMFILHVCYVCHVYLSCLSRPSGLTRPSCSYITTIMSVTSFTILKSITAIKYAKSITFIPCVLYVFPIVLHVQYVCQMTGKFLERKNVKNNSIRGSRNPQQPCI